MISDFMKRQQEERKAASKFTAGSEVAIVNHHWERTIVRKARVVKVYATGNFTITKPDGTPDPQQWRPSMDGVSARQAQGRDGVQRYRSDHLEPWTPKIDEEIRVTKLNHDLDATRDKYIARLKKLQGFQLEAVLIGMSKILPAVVEETKG